MDVNLLEVRKIVNQALSEDVGNGDITTRLTIPLSATASGVMIAKESGVIAGLAVAGLCFNALDQNVIFTPLVQDGDTVPPGCEIARMSGSAQSILSAERVALNFLQRMSGIATMTDRFVTATAGTKTRIVDTRKTTPGLRILEKYAVRVGGGFNHRFGLDDGILIKDNHIAVAGGVGSAVRAARAQAPHTLKVEVEVRSLSQVEEALANRADAVLLDNMSVDEMRESVKLIDGRIVAEASGGVDQDTVAVIAATGVDIISVGRLTHSFRSLDISLDIRVADSTLPEDAEL